MLVYCASTVVAIGFNFSGNFHGIQYACSCRPEACQTRPLVLLDVFERRFGDHVVTPDRTCDPRNNFDTNTIPSFVQTVFPINVYFGWWLKSI